MAVPLRIGWSRIQHEPVHPDLARRLQELLEVHRLHDVTVRSEPVGLEPVALLRRRGEHHHRQQLRVRMRANGVEYFEPVAARQLQIEQDHDRKRLRRPGRRAVQDLQRLLPVARDDQLIGQLLPANAISVSSMSSSLSSTRRMRLTVTPAPAPPRVKRNVAPRPGADSAQTRPSCRWTMRCTMARPIPVPSNSFAMQPLKWREQFLRELRVEPDAVVADEQRVPFPADLDPRVAPRGRELHRVADEVLEDDADQVRVRTGAKPGSIVHSIRRPSRPCLRSSAATTR